MVTHHTCVPFIFDKFTLMTSFMVGRHDSNFRKIFWGGFGSPVRISFLRTPIPSDGRARASRSHYGEELSAAPRGIQKVDQWTRYLDPRRYSQSKYSTFIIYQCDYIMMIGSQVHTINWLPWKEDIFDWNSLSFKIWIPLYISGFWCLLLTHPQTPIAQCK